MIREGIGKKRRELNRMRVSQALLKGFPVTQCLSEIGNLAVKLGDAVT